MNQKEKIEASEEKIQETICKIKKMLFYGRTGTNAFLS